MAKLLEGKCAVITGGAGLIGTDISLAMGREGVKVVVNDIGKGEDGTPLADKVVEQIKKEGGTAIANYDSILDFAAAEKIINTCIETYGRIDILVNCAAAGGPGRSPFWETSEEDWDRVVEGHLKGTFNMCRHALGPMINQNYGRIVIFSSPAATGVIGPHAYNASKGAIASLTHGIGFQMELEGYNVTCNAMSPIAGRPGYGMGPGPIDPEVMKQRQQANRESWERKLKAGLVTLQVAEETINRPDPEHTAPVVLYLCTDEGAKINGQIIGTGAGRMAVYSYLQETRGLYKDGVFTLDELVKRVPMTLLEGIRKARG